MKLISCVVFLGLAAYVYSESCTVNGDCSSTTCASGYHVICEHPDTGVTDNGGLCTCAVDDYSCTNRQDCLGDNIVMNCIDQDHRHCYDGKCICTRW